jgi:hypothetical protein
MTREYRIYGVRYECSSEEDRIRIIKRVESKLDGEIRGYKYEETAQSSDILNELLKNKEK